MKNKTIAKHIVVAAVLGFGLTLAACTTPEDDTTITPGYQLAADTSQDDQNADSDEQDESEQVLQAAPALGQRITEPRPVDPEQDLSGRIDFAATADALDNQLARPTPGEEFAVIITNFGEIHLRLFPEEAPLAVQNFTTHAIDGFYDDLIFHRVIYGFMLQGGCSLGTGTGGNSIWGRGFGDELTTNLRHIRGALSMANTGQPFSNSSQFFIVHNYELQPHVVDMKQDFIDSQDDLVGDGAGGYLDEYLVGDVWPAKWMQHYIDHGGAPHLDYRHTVFGHVFYGMDVVDAIAAVPVNDSLPIEPVVIYRIEIRIY